MLSVCSAFGECGAPPRWNEISFAGKQLRQLGTVSGTSPLSGASPALEAGDVWVLDALTTPGNYVITTTATGDFSVAAGGDTSRQLINDNAYDMSLRAYYGAGVIPVNNLPPYLLGGPSTGLFAGQVFKKDADPGTISLASLLADPEGDTFTFAVQSGSLPTGWSLAANGNRTGTGTVYGTYSYTIRVTDQYGDYLDVADSAVIGDEIPDVADDLEAAARTAIEAVANFTVAAENDEEYSDPVEIGRVIRTEPPIGTLAPDDQEVTLTVSLGELSEGALATTFLDALTAVPATAVFRSGQAFAQDGSRYVALWPASNAVFYDGPFAFRSDGALIIATSGTIAARPQGVALTYRGEVLADQDTPDHVHNGWPLLDSGYVCMSDIQ